VARLTSDDDGVEIVVAPYETMFLETITAADDEGPSAADAPVRATIAADAPEITSREREEEGRAFTYRWTGSVTVPEVSNAELCVLLEGPADIAGAQGSVRLNGRNARLVRNESAGQFGAAVESSSENWVWLRTPIAPGQRTFEITLNVPLEGASVGVYLRGSVPVANDAVPDEAAPFPVYRPEQQAWSHTLQPLMAVRDESAGEN
jgi:hypothetical protein